VIILPEIYLWTRNNCLNLGNRPHPDPDVGILKEFFNAARKDIYPQWRRQLWSTATRAPLDFQQFIFIYFGVNLTANYPNIV